MKLNAPIIFALALAFTHSSYAIESSPIDDEALLEAQTQLAETPDQSTMITLTDPKTLSDQDLELKDAIPLGNGVRSKKNKHVLQLYCLKKDAQNENACVRAQYAIFNDDELLPKDALGNTLVKKRSLTGIGPILTIETAAEVKDKLAKLISDKRAIGLSMPKIQFQVTKYIYGKRFDNVRDGDDIPFIVGFLSVGGASGLLAGGDLIAGAALGGVAVLGLGWPMITDIVVNTGKQALALTINAEKLITFPFKRLLGRSRVSAQAITESFTKQEGYNWAEKPLEINKKMFDELVTAIQ